MQRTSAKVQDYARLGGKDDSLVIMQESEIWPY